MVGAGDAVEPRRVHPRGFGGGLQKGFSPASLAGEAVVGHREGDNQKGLRTALLQIPGQLRDSLPGGQGFGQEAGDARPQELTGQLAVDRSGPAVLGHGADVPEHEGPIGLRRRLGQLAGGMGQPGGVLPLGQHGAEGKGVGLDGPAPRLQIGPVDGGNLLRGVQVGQLAPEPGPPRLGGVAGAHGPVKDQRLPLGQIGTDIRHENTSRAMSTEARASLA